MAIWESFPATVTIISMAMMIPSAPPNRWHPERCGLASMCIPRASQKRFFLAQAENIIKTSIN